jgi:hypothetical protein
MPTVSPTAAAKPSARGAKTTLIPSRSPTLERAARSATPLTFVIGIKGVAAGSSAIGVGGPAGCSEVKTCQKL